MMLRGTLAIVSLWVLVACETAEKIPTGSLNGRAVYAGLSDHSGISVTASGFSTTTDAAGSYAFDSLPVGRYAVVAIAPRSAERTLATTVNVSAGGNSAPDLSFTPLQALAGQLTVLGAPAAGATVTLDGAATTTTDANGIYSFSDARPGEHSLAFAATGAAPDAIANVLYSPDLGAFTPHPYFFQLMFRLEPFDLQVARRLVSLNMVNPGRGVEIAPVISPNGALYAYGLSNDLGLTSIFVGSTAGGAPVLVVSDNSNDLLVRFSPNSKFLTFARRNAFTDITDLWVAELGAGPTVVKTEKVVENISNFDFSPQTAGASGPTVYVHHNDSAAFSGKTLSERTLGGAAGVGSVINSWQGVPNFFLSKKQNRIIFRWSGTSATPSHRLVSAATTGAAVTPSNVEGPQNAAFDWSFLAFSPDESRWAYSISNQDVGGTVPLGLKVVPTSNVSKSIMSSDAFPDCVSFDATGQRIVWVRQDAQVTRKTDASAPENVLVPFNPSYFCPTFTSDNRVWVGFYDGQGNIALAPADPGALSTLESGTDIDAVFVARNGSLAVFTRNAGPTTEFFVRRLAGTSSTKFDTANDTGQCCFLTRNGSAVLYTKRELGIASAPETLYWVGLSGATPTTPVRVVQRWSPGLSLVVSEQDESRAIATQFEEEGNFLTAVGVNMTTGVPKPLLRRVSTFAIQDVGTGTTTPKAIFFRTGSNLPYSFQDGVYIADP
jgi:hypothetical protein